MDSSDEVMIRLGVVGDEAAIGSLQRVKGEMQGVEASGRKFGDSMSRAGQRMALGITLPMTLVGKSAFGLASDLNEAMSATTVIYGENAKAVLSWSDSTAKSMGISQVAALSAMNQFGALFTGMGLSVPVAQKFGQEMVQAASDLGSFYNVDPGQVLQDLRSGLVGEAEPLRKYGILLNEASVNQEAMRLGLVAVNGEFTEAQKVQARQSLIMRSLGQANGDFTRTAGGVANMTRIVRAQFADMAAQWGQVMLPVGLRVLQFASRLAMGLQGVGRTTRVVVVAFAALLAAAGPLLIVAGNLVKAWGLVSGAITLPLAPILLVVGALAALGFAYKTNVLGFGDAVNAVASRVWGALAPITGAFANLITHMRNVWAGGANVTAMFDGMSPALRGIFRAVGLIVGGFRDIKDALFPAREVIAGFAIGMGQVTAAVPQVERLRRLLDVFPSALGKIVDGFGLLGARLWAAFVDLPWGQWLADLTSGMTTAFNAIPWGSIWDGTVALLKGVVNGAIDLGTIIVGAIFSAGGDILSWAGDAAGWVKQQLTAGVDRIALPPFSAVVSAVFSAGGDVLRWAGNAAGWIKQQLMAGLDSIELPSVNAVVSAVFSAGGDILRWAGNASGWVKQQVMAGLSRIELPSVDAVVNAALSLGGDLLALKNTGVGRWIADRFFAGEFILPIAAMRVATKLGLDPAVTFTDVAKAVGDGVVAAVTGLADLGSRVAGAIAEKIGGFRGWIDLITSDSFDLGNAVGVALRGAIGKAIEVATGVAGGVLDALRRVEFSPAGFLSVAAKIAKGLGAILLAGPVLFGSLVTAFASFMGGLITGLVFGEDADFDSIVTKIADGIKSAFGAAGDWALGIVMAITDGIFSVAINPGLYAGIAAGIAGGIWQKTKEAFTSATGWASDLITSIASGLRDSVTADMFAGVASAIASAIWDGVKGIARGWSVSDLIPGMGGDDSKPSGGDKGGAGGGSSGGFNLGGAGASGALGAVTGGLGAVKGAATSVKVSVDVKGAIESLTTFRTKLSETRGAASSFASDTGGIFLRWSATVAQAGRDGGERFRGALAGALSSARATASQTTNQIASALAGLAGRAGSAGSSAGQSFSSRLAGALGEAVGAAAATVSRIRGVLQGDLSGGGYGMGASFGQGLISGMNAYMDAVYAAASRLAQQIIDGANAVIKKSSPSRAARELASSVPDGMVVALRDGMDAVRRAALALGDAALPSPGTVALRVAPPPPAPVAVPVTPSMVPVPLSVNADRGRVIHQTFNVTVSLEDAKQLIEFSEFVDALPGARLQVVGG